MDVRSVDGFDYSRPVCWLELAGPELRWGSPIHDMHTQPYPNPTSTDHERHHSDRAGRRQGATNIDSNSGSGSGSNNRPKVSPYCTPMLPPVLLRSPTPILTPPPHPTSQTHTANPPAPCTTRATRGSGSWARSWRWWTGTYRSRTPSSPTATSSTAGPTSACWCVFCAYYVRVLCVLCVGGGIHWWAKGQFHRM